MNALMHRRGLAFKLILAIFASISVVFFLIFVYNYQVSRKLVHKNLVTSAQHITESTVLRVQKVLEAVQKVPLNYAGVIASSDYSRPALYQLLRQMVEQNEEVFGAALAFEPYAFDASRRGFSPYVCRSGDSVSFQFIEYDYFSMDWYRVPKQLNRPVWSEPYYDEGAGNALMCTYSVPIYREQNGRREFLAVLTSDISLDWLQQYMDSVKICETGYGYIISSKGTLVSHPNPKLIMKETIFSIADTQKSSVLRAVGERMVQGGSSFAEVEYRNVLTGKLSWLAYAPIPANSWSVGIVFPVDEFMADVNRLFRNLMVMCVAGILILLAVVVLISRTITRPLRRLARAASHFAQGNFDIVLPVIKSHDEIGRLNQSFITMQSALAQTIGELKDASEQLQEYNRTLEQKVDERTAELRRKNEELVAAQAQLVQSEKMASLGQLTAGIAHEIKNPLNFVNNFAELTVDLASELGEELGKMEADIPQRDREYLCGLVEDIGSNARKINDHGKRADSIVKGMLLHSRGKSGDRQPTDINALLAEYVNLGYHGMRAQDNSFNLKIEADYDATLGLVNVVPQNLSRVFLNIINNACYSTHQKKKELKDAYFPVLSVQTRNLEDRVEIRIRDNGVGIPREILDKVFQPFFTTKPAGQGTGLGLSLSYDIVVQEHRGELRVDSEVGSHAEFVIVLPK